MGVCASTGGMFNNYAIVQGVDQIVPVDVYAPGCPPTPETLIHAITTLRKNIETGEIMRRRRSRPGAGADVHVEAVPQTATRHRQRRPMTLADVRPPPALRRVAGTVRRGAARARRRCTAARVVESLGQTVVHPTRRAVPRR